MKKFRISTLTLRISIIITLVHFSVITRSQTTGSIQPIPHFTGSAGFTNNGISVIPTFSFDKPTAIALMAVGQKRLTFEPDVRSTLDAKRGGLALWWRYKILIHGKFRLNTGVQQSMNWAATADSAKQNTRSMLQTQPFLAGELVPSYMISENVSVGIYYLYAHGLHVDGPRNVHFVTLNANFSYIKITGQLFLQWVPQFYYLNIDGQDGVYFTSSATLMKMNFPFSLQSSFNKTIKTNIAGDKNFLWNISLFYAFKG